MLKHIFTQRIWESVVYYLLPCILADRTTVHAAWTRMIPAFIATENIEKTMYQENLPSLSEFTMCFWFKGDLKDDYRQVIYSLAIPDNFNEMMINIEQLNDEQPYLSLITPGKKTRLYHENLLTIAQELHKHCLTWQSGSNFQWYVDISEPGKVELISSASCGSQVVREGGTMVLMQEQDAVLGGFVLNQNIGVIADFNMWDYEMTETEIMNLACDSKGNLSNWDTLKLLNNPTIDTITVPNCYGEPRKYHGPRFDSITLCKIEGGSLEHPDLAATSEEKEANCIKKCMRNVDCVSLNYQRSTGQCHLSSLLHTDWNSNLLTELGSDYIHWSSGHCSSTA